MKKCGWICYTGMASYLMPSFLGKQSFTLYDIYLSYRKAFLFISVVCVCQKQRSEEFFINRLHLKYVLIR